jgi:Ser/Thr protein kinase RdoA (MazF antagonist)
MLSGEQVTEVVHRFSLGTDPVLGGAPVRGELGQVWPVRTTTGTWAVKELFTPDTETEARASADFQEAAVNNGVPAPAVIRTLDGDVLIDLAGRQFRVFSWVNVEPPDRGLDPAAVGSIVGAVHRMAYPATGPARPWYTDPVGEERWDELLGQMAVSGHPRAEELMELRNELCALELLLEEPQHLQRLHLDLWADNVRVTPSGDLCVLDWDNSGPGDPRQELAVVLLEYGSGSPTRARTLVESYLDAGGAAHVTRPEDFSMAIAQLGHILEWQCGNWLAATTPDQRARAEDAVDEFIAEPLTRDVIEQLVDAVA